MPKSKRLIVGLGNPGPNYERTRHNVGFEAADAVAEYAGIVLERVPGNVLLGWGRLRSDPVGVAKPMTYMNRSGRAVGALIGMHRLDPRGMLVIVDDINLEPGRLRLRASGGAGGHNGLRDVIDRLGHGDFPRLRIGIGNAFSRGRQVDYVLSPFSPEERPHIDQAVARAVQAVESFVCEGMATAMSRFNVQASRTEAGLSSHL